MLYKRSPQMPHISKTKECRSGKTNSERQKPQCVRCRNHGIKADKKGHKKDCKWKECDCRKCILLIQRKEVESKSKALEQKEKPNKHSNERLTESYCPKSNSKSFEILNKFNAQIEVNPNPIQIQCMEYSRGKVRGGQTGFCGLPFHTNLSTTEHSVQKCTKNNFDNRSEYNKQLTNHSIDKILESKEMSQINRQFDYISEEYNTWNMSPHPHKPLSIEHKSKKNYSWQNCSFQTRSFSHITVS